MSAAALVVIRARAERHKAYDFVKGLNNDQFGAIRTQILGMAPFPTLYEASYIAMSKAYNLDPNNIPIEEVFQQLKCTQDGLTSKEATRRLKIFGPNRLDGEKKKNKFLKLFGFIKGSKRANVGPKCKLLRDNKWKELNAAGLAPGDIIRIKFGDIVPADARLLQGDSIMVNQYVLTGESLPVTRAPGDEVFSGSTCTQGETEAIVIATGVHTTFFGKAAHLVDTTNNAGHFKKRVKCLIANFCIISIAVGIMFNCVCM